MNESALLGSCLVAKFALGAAQEEGVRPEHFYSPAHARVWTAMVEAQAQLGKDEQLDAILVGRALGDDLDEVGGRGFLHALVSAAPSPTNVRQYARTLIEEWTERTVRATLQAGLESGLRGAELLSDVQSALYQIERPRSGGGTLRTGLTQVWEEMENPEPMETRLSWPWPSIEYTVRGLRKGSLYCLAGRTGAGKSAAGLQLADWNIRRGRKVLLVSLELTLLQIAERFAMGEGYDPSRVHFGRGNEHDAQAISRLMGQQHIDNLIVEWAEDAAQIGALARRYQPDLIVVDHIHIMPAARGESRYEVLTRTTRDLKLLARRLDLPVLMLAQLSRAEARRNEIPDLPDLRDSGSIEQDSDVVLFVWRKSDDNNELTAEGALRVAKQRQGKTGSIPVAFRGGEQRFVEV